MSTSQKFPVAVHALVALARRGALDEAARLPAHRLAACIPTHPVVMRRVTALLNKAGLTGARAGSGGGVWLVVRPETISLAQVLSAVGGTATLGTPLEKAISTGSVPSERLRSAVAEVMRQAEAAALLQLSALSIADLAATAERG